MMKGKYYINDTNLTFTVNSKINSKIATGPRSHYLNLKNDESIDQSKNVDYTIND